MPQVHNKTRLLDQDPSAFSKNSRYMSTLRFTEGSLRRMNAQNILDQRLTRVKLNYFERHADIQQKKYQRAKNRIIDKIQRNLAYKMVLKQHSIAKSKNYKKALDGKYTYHALHYEVNDMMRYIQPEMIRERQARALIDRNKQRYEDLLRKNQKTYAIIFPTKKTWEAFDFSKIKTKGASQDDDEKSQGEESVISPLPQFDPRRGRLLMRRIIEEPKSIPNSKPGSSGSGTVSPRKQGITMNMMKKQRSFIENQEKITHTGETTQENAVIDSSNETETLGDNVLKSDNNESDDSKDLKGNEIKLPAIDPKQGVSKFMKPKGTGIASKLRSLSLNPKMNPKIKLPSLKMRKGSLQSEKQMSVQV